MQSELSLIDSYCNQVEKNKNLVELKVSDVYDYLDIKYIYSMVKVMPQNSQDIKDVLIITKRYVYVNDNKNWILSVVEVAYYDGEFSIDKMKNSKFKNKQVEYNQEFVLLD